MAPIANQPDDPNAAQPQPGAQPDQDTQADDSTEQDDQQNDSSLPDDDDSGLSINVQRLLSSVNENVVKFADRIGVKRTATIPYIDGQEAAEHIQTVGKALAQVGGSGINLVVSYHHAAGRGYGYGDGETVLFSSPVAHQTIIPKNFAPAKAVVAAERKLVNSIAKFLGKKSPAVLKTNDLIDLVAKHDGAGMTAADFITAGLTLPTAALAAIARLHSGTKGGHAPHLRAPRIS